MTHKTRRLTDFSQIENICPVFTVISVPAAILKICLRQHGTILPS